jgi:hypothetical protein
VRGVSSAFRFGVAVQLGLLGWLTVATPSCSTSRPPLPVFGSGGVAAAGGTSSHPETVPLDDPLIDGGGGGIFELVSGACYLSDRGWSESVAHFDIIPCPDGYDCSSTGTENVGGAAGSAGAAGAAGASSIETWPYTVCPRGGSLAAVFPGCVAHRECIQPPTPTDDGQLSCCYLLVEGFCYEVP